MTEKADSTRQSPAAPEGAAGRRSRPRLSKLLLLLASLAVAVGVAEIGLRVCFRGTFHILQDERNALFRYDKMLGWFPAPNSAARLTASRTITVVHNSQGFRAPEPVNNGKPAMVLLGDSFVWGYDVEAAERFGDKLQAKHPEWNILNLGVSGYGTDQEYLLLQQRFDAYHPRIVLLVFCVETDREDNSRNVRYNGYYKPYCTIEGNHLDLRGIPVPRAEKVYLAEHDLLAHSYVVRLLARAWFALLAPRPLTNPDPTDAIILDLQKYVKMKGAILLVGLTRSDPDLEELLRLAKIDYLDLSTSLRYSGFGGHWTPEGHTVVCNKVEEFLLKGKYLDARP